MRVLAVLAAAVALTGCAPTLSAVNPAGGIVGNHGWSQAKSMALAEGHCQKYGKHAVVTDTNDLEATLSFSCVP